MNVPCACFGLFTFVCISALKDDCADEMSAAYRQFFLRQIHYLLKAKSVEHRCHGLRLDQIFDAAGRSYAAGQRIQRSMSQDPREVRSTA